MLDFLNLSNPELIPYIRSIGYPTMLLVMTIEGPIASIVSAFLASLGVFNIVIVFFLSVLGDVLGDVVCYAIGYFGGSRAIKKAEKILKVKPKVIEKMEKLFHEHGFRTIFAVKSTTGLCWITFIAAGAVRMELKKFLRGSILGGLIWSSFLVISGYFFGYAFEKIGLYIKYAGFAIIFIVIIFFIAINFYKKLQSKKILITDNSH